MKWRIGCSGFHYKDWKGVFYPEKLTQKEWFQFYCTQFDTLELNVTFYRFPQVSFLRNWYAQSPEGFDFAVKVPRLITHYKQFNDTTRMLSDFYGSVREGLKEKLGPVLFQLPAKFEFSTERLERIVESLDPGFMNVVEFRHKSWWNVEAFTQLAKNKVTFCGVSFPGLPADAITKTNPAYYRFHGIPKLYYSQYDEATLKAVADQIAGASKVKKAYVYFNNTATQAAINNAMFLKSYCSELH
jgi:uncharacterized protein YecE (DUF72 family)